MDVDLSLDEIIERKRIHNPPRTNEKKLNAVLMKPRKPLNKPTGGGGGGGVGGLGGQQHQRSFDARNKIIQKARAKIIDARDILNQNIRDSGIDARNVLLERKKERMPMPMPLPMPSQPRGGSATLRGAVGSGTIHKGRFGQRIITMSNRPGGLVQTLWDPKDDHLATHSGFKTSRLNAAAKPFVPRGYVDYDNMQELEDEEIARTLHLSSYNSSPPSGVRPRLTRTYDGYELEMDGVEITSPSLAKNMAADPFAIYETSRNRLERPSPLMSGHVHGHGHGHGHGDGGGGEKMYDRRQRSMLATSNLPESLRARLFGNEPDRRVSHGIYANENGSGQSKAGHGAPSSSISSMNMHQRRSPPSAMSMAMPLPLSVVNNKTGYRLLVSNLHSNVTTADIRELFNDIGPMYDAHVVRPGTAEVIYKSLEHAEMAVDAYHQREFDGQPMHCVLVNPHSSNRNAHSVSSRTVTTNSSGVEVDIDALHSVLFRDR